MGCMGFPCLLGLVDLYVMSDLYLILLNLMNFLCGPTPLKSNKFVVW